MKGIDFDDDDTIEIDIEDKYMYRQNLHLRILHPSGNSSSVKST